MKHVHPAPILRTRPARAAGFTLVEIMVVVLILGLLASLVASSVATHLATAKEEKARADVASLAAAIKIWLAKNGTLPEHGIADLLRKDSNGHAYLDRYSRDPWDQDYVIRSTGDRPDAFAVVCLGPDRAEGTADDIRSDATDVPR